MKRVTLVVAAMTAWLAGIAYADAPAKGTSSAPAAPDMTDIIDIKPPVELPFDWGIVYYTLAVLAALALLGALAWYIRRKLTVPDPPPPPEKPHVRAQRLLRQLEPRMNALTPREYYFELSEIVRQYLEGRFGFGALEMTESELLPEIRLLPVGQDLRARLEDLVKRSEPVKFAGSHAGRTAMRDDLAFAEKFVSLTAPRFEEVSETQGAHVEADS